MSHPMAERLRAFSLAYPEDIFVPLGMIETQENSMIVTRASAGMGRHLAKIMAEAADEIDRLSEAVTEKHSE
jgi:hypothetical protein